MPPLAAQQFDMVVEKIVVVANSEPAKVVAQRTGLTERGVRAIREREHAPSLDTAIRFGWAYPDVAAVWEHWSARMRQTDLFTHEEQRAFHRDYARAGRNDG